jgi:hypothetical protein
LATGGFPLYHCPETTGRSERTTAAQAIEAKDKQWVAP